MSQPQFQPPQPGQQPQQPPQPPQYNPYAGGPAMPQQPPGPAPAAPPQMPMQPPMQPPMQQGWPGQQPLPGFPMQPGQPQPRSGSPAGAIFLALLVSFLVTLLYAGGRAAAWQVITTNAAAIGVWALAILVNGAAVGLVAGKVGGSGTGTRVGAVIVAVLGAFFSSANAAVGMVISVQGWSNFVWAWKNDPFFPAKAWWGIELHWLSVLGLVVAGGLAFVLAFAVGRKRR
jgi:hypothetical protein